MYFEPFDKSTFDDFLREANTKPDYNTNASSYYKDLARKNHLIKLLSKRIWDYDIELAKRFEEWDKNLEDFPEDVKQLLRDWIDDGTFAEIINEEIFSWKADKVDLDATNALLSTLENKSVGVTSILNYEPTGTDWTSAFNEALSTGKDVYVPKGFEFLIGDVVVESAKVFGGGTIIKKSDSVTAFHVKGSGTEISGLVFNPQNISGQPNTDIKLGENAKDVKILNNTFKGSIYSAIAGSDDSIYGGIPYYQRVQGVIISGNTFKGYGRPVFLHSIENITIVNNIFRDTNYDAIRLRENDGYCLIDGNQFINIGNGDWSDLQTKDALDVYWSGDTLTVVNNMVRKTAFAGFDIKGIKDNDKTQKVIIGNNQIRECRFNGIHVSGDIDTGVLFSDSIIIHDNIITACNQAKGGITDGNGIHIKGNVKYLNIHDNMIISNFGRGIFVNNAYQESEQKSIKISGNLCINNGQASSASNADAGIHVIGVNGVIITDNICELDETLDNPVQNTGIYFVSVDTVSTPKKTAIIKGNITRNNRYKQIFIESNGNRANNIAVFSDNIQEGTGAVDRVTWQHQRSVLFGVTFPAVGDGTFRQGDIVYNVEATASGNVGWICTVSGNPGTWKPFGTIAT